MFRQFQAAVLLRLLLLPGVILCGEMLAFQTLRALTGFHEYYAVLERFEKE